MKENRGKGWQGWNIRGRKVKDLSIGRQGRKEHAKNGTARRNDLEEKDRDVMQKNEGRAQSKEIT